MKQINIWDLWAKNWENAYNFFKSEGNAKTKGRLKNKWYKQYMDDLKSITNEVEILQNELKRLHDQIELTTSKK